MPLNPRVELFAKILFFSAIVYFPLFMHLENLPIRQWDEARLAVNAYEMSQNGNYIVVHYDGSPEMWNTKPPLMIWLQVLCLKIFGTGELAIRLPAALAGLFTCLGILLFASRFLKNFWLGMIAVLVLMTTNGYVHVHVTRSGDYDSLLIFATTLYALVFFIFLETNKTKFLYLAAAFLIVGALTKGIAAFLFLPALFLYTLVKGKLLPLLKNPHLYGGILLVVVCVGGYYFLREQLNPGYLKAVMENELGGRYLKPLEGHDEPFWFYFFHITGGHFSPWYLLVPVGILLGLFHRERVMRNLSLYLTLLVVVFFFAISISKTRIEWYNAPLFPFLAFIVAIFLWYWFDLFSTSQLFSQQLQKNVLPYALLLLVFLTPYATIARKGYKPQEEWIKEYTFLHQLQKGLQGKKDLNNYSLCCVQGSTAALFYVRGLQDKGVSVDFADHEALQPGDVAMAFEDNIKREIESLYAVTVLEQKHNVRIYQINEVCL